MDHLPYVAGAYGLTLAIILTFGIGSAVRLRRAKRRVAAVQAAQAGRGA